MLTCTENRELSWLRFNERVLEEAEDERVPLCERLSFLSIFQSNLDEFFMVRIGSLHDQMLLDKEARENKTNMTPGEQIDAAVSRIRTLCDRRDRTYADVLKKLEDEGISIVNFRQISPESEQYLAKIFREDYLPLLSTYVVGKKQTFPFLKNKEIYAVAVLRTGSEKEKIGIVPCGENMFPRLIEVPERTGCYILSEELILHYLPLLFGSYRIASKTLARITRSADIDADSVYDEDLNYRDHMAEVVRLRQKLCPVRLELSRKIGHDIIEKLCDQLKLDTARVYEYDTPLDISFLFNIQDKLRSHAELFYAPRHPQATPDIVDNRPVMEQILEKDLPREMQQMGLEIARDVHEIKKDYIRIIQGIEEAIEEESNEETMSLQDLLRILESSTYRTMAEKKLDIRLMFDCRDNFMTQEHYQLMTILKNLVGNAVEAIESTKKSGMIWIREYKKDGNYVFEVADDGPGISEKHLPRIFNMGYSTKFDEKTGNIYRGVGLCGVKNAVEEQFEGSISVDSEEGRGTKFHIEIPIAKLEEIE